jgi:hypothetical protein
VRWFAGVHTPSDVVECAESTTTWHGRIHRITRLFVACCVEHAAMRPPARVGRRRTTLPLRSTKIWILKRDLSRSWSRRHNVRGHDRIPGSRTSSLASRCGDEKTASLSRRKYLYSTHLCIISRVLNDPFTHHNVVVHVFGHNRSALHVTLKCHCGDERNVCGPSTL